MDSSKLREGTLDGHYKEICRAVLKCTLDPLGLLERYKNMFLPYITKYKCGSCEKIHRVTFKQWKDYLFPLVEYLQVHSQVSDVDTGIKRTEDKFKFKVSKLGKWVWKKVL